MMARVAVFLLLALAALAQATLPSSARDATKVVSYDQKAKPLCKECEKVITGLKKILENPEFEQKLIDTLKKVCSLPLLSNFKDQCLNLVNDAVVVIHELQSLLDNPDQVCDAIKMCDSQAPGVKTVSRRLMLSIASKIIQDIHKPAINIDTCSLCTSALNELKTVLNIPQIVVEVEAEAQKICKYFGKFQQTCNQILGQLIPKVLDIIEDALEQPQSTCGALHLCKQQQSSQLDIGRLIMNVPRAHPHVDRFLAKITDIQTVRGFKVGCLACETGVDAALKYLSSDKVVSSLDTDITNFVCNTVFSKLSPTQVAPCLDFMGIYFKTAIQLTFAEWTPNQICSAVKICKSSSSEQIFKNLSPGEKSKVTCDACKVLSKTLAFELQNPKVQQDIITLLTQVCLHLPGKYDYKVQSYVQTYTSYVLDDIVAVSLVPELCTSILQLC